MDVATDLDHLMLGVSDLETAGSAFERLGFTVTPRSEHTAMGTANRCVMLTSASSGVANYVELITLTRRDRAPEGITELLAGPDGVKAVVLATRDLEASVSALAARGLGSVPIFGFDRTVELPTGDAATLAFSVAMVPRSASPVPAILCQHHTLETLAQPQWQRHANGAQHLTACTIVSPGPRHVATHLGHLFGISAGARREPDEAAVLSPGQVTFRILGPAALRRRHPRLGPDLPDRMPCLLGCTVQVSDLRRTAEHLHDSGITVATDTDHTRAFVAPSDACGALIEFEQAGLRP